MVEYPVLIASRAGWVITVGDYLQFCQFRDFLSNLKVFVVSYYRESKGFYNIIEIFLEVLREN